MTGEDKERLEARLEELKEALYEFDRALSGRIGLSGKPSAREKKERQAIVREINRVRRSLYRLSQGGPPRRLILTLSENEAQRIEQEAAAEGMSLKQYLRKKLLD